MGNTMLFSDYINSKTKVVKADSVLNEMVNNFLYLSNQESHINKSRFKFLRLFKLHKVRKELSILKQEIEEKVLSY